MTELYSLLKAVTHPFC